jgi:hypothetical protein
LGTAEIWYLTIKSNRSQVQGSTFRVKDKEGPEVLVKNAHFAE